MSKVLVNESSLTGIADAIRGKNGSTDTYKPSEMAAAITAISGGGGSGVDIPDEAFVISGDLSYWDYKGKWDSFITAYADKWSTSNIVEASSMFYGCKLAQIPFSGLAFRPALPHVQPPKEAAAWHKSSHRFVSLETVSNYTSSADFRTNIWSVCRKSVPLPPI